MTGFVGLTSRSTTGARSRSMPSPASVADRLRPLPRVDAVVTGAERSLGGRGREAVPGLEPVHFPTLFVDRDQERDRRRSPEPGNKRPQLGRRCDVPVVLLRRRVVVEEEHATETPIADVRDRLRRAFHGQPAESDEEHLSDLRPESGLGNGHPRSGVGLGPSVWPWSWAVAGRSRARSCRGGARQLDVAMGASVRTKGPPHMRRGSVARIAVAPTPRRKVRRERVGRAWRGSLTRPSSIALRNRAGGRW